MIARFVAALAFVGGALLSGCSVATLPPDNGSVAAPETAPPPSATPGVFGGQDEPASALPASAGALGASCRPPLILCPCFAAGDTCAPAGTCAKCCSGALHC
jgi:hypothetical protein